MPDGAKRIGLGELAHAFMPVTIGFKVALAITGVGLDLGIGSHTNRLRGLLAATCLNVPG